MGFYDNNTFFDATLAKSKGYYRFLIRLKGTLPNSAKKLQSEFSIDATNLTMFYSLPKSVCLETYLRNFQFKELNYITRGGYRGGWIGWISTPHFSVKKNSKCHFI